jgi:hypothetical protein
VLPAAGEPSLSSLQNEDLKDQQDDADELEPDDNSQPRTQLPRQRSQDSFSPHPIRQLIQETKVYPFGQWVFSMVSKLALHPQFEEAEDESRD